MGVSVFPPGSRPAGHVHDRQEETIYCAGRARRIVTPEATAEVEAGGDRLGPGRACPCHRVRRTGAPELVCFFSPPVVPGSYEKKAAS